MSSKLFGGSESFTKELERQIASAAAQAAGISDEGPRKAKGQKKNPSFILSADVWKPWFVKGVSVEFESCTCESTYPGDFIVVRQGVRLTVCRIIDWWYDGHEIAIMVLTAKGQHKAARLVGASFLGRVLTTGIPNGKERYKPNDRAWYSALWGSLTRYGTCNSVVGSFRLLKEGLLVMSTKKEERPKDKTFWESLRIINQWHRVETAKAAEEAAHKAALERERQEQDRQALDDVSKMNPSNWWKS